MVSGKLGLAVAIPSLAHLTRARVVEKAGGRFGDGEFCTECVWMYAVVIRDMYVVCTS